MVDIPPPLPLQRQDAICVDYGARTCVTCAMKVPRTAPHYAKQCKECYRNPGLTKRKCRVCDKPKLYVTDPTWKQVCGLCFKNANFKPCQQCRLPNLRTTDPEWRKICTTCYQNKELWRECGTCKQRTIKPGTEDWIYTCTACYIKMKELDEKEGKGEVEVQEAG